MDEPVGKPRPAAAAMKDVLQAEVEARETVEAARNDAARRVESARQRARTIENAALQRIRKVNASTRDACDELCRRAQQERETRLACLEQGWQVNTRAQSLKRAVREFALALITGGPNHRQS